jgi:hypothetical protein
MRLDTSQRLPRLFFTAAGLVELRRMMADRRLADPKKFAHIRQELGLENLSRKFRLASGPHSPPTTEGSPADSPRASAITGRHRFEAGILCSTSTSGSP